MDVNYKLGKLDDKIDHLKNILRYSKETQNLLIDNSFHTTHMVFLDMITKVPIKKTLTPLSIKLNQLLTDFFKEEFNIIQNSIVSIHVNEYEEGAECLPHRDSNSEDTILILLNSCDKGGDLLLENKSIGLNEEGQYVSYNGGNVTHGVTKVEKGFRKL